MTTSKRSPAPPGLDGRILKARKRSGLIQEDFAREVGVRVKQVSRWERGENMPRWDQLEAIAKVGGVTTDWLMTGAEPDEKRPKAAAKSAYPSLQGFLERRPDITAREQRFLVSQDLGSDDVGSDDFWSSQLTVFRAQLVGAQSAVAINREVDAAMKELSSRHLGSKASSGAAKPHTQG